MDPALPVGQNYSDADAGLTVTTKWADGVNAGVDVSFARPGCVSADPTIVISSSTTDWAIAGTSVTYSVVLTNNDPATCTTALFNLSTSLPSGWTASFAVPSLALSSGESYTTTLTVTSPVSASDGFYDMTVMATNNDTPSAAASVSTTYVVSAQNNQSPVAVDDSATTVQGKSVSIAVLANDWDPDGDLLYVKSVNQGTKGTVVIGADGTLTYTPAPNFRVKDSIGYTVTDGTDSATAFVTVSSETRSERQPSNSFSQDIFEKKEAIGIFPSPLPLLSLSIACCNSY